MRIIPLYRLIQVLAFPLLTVYFAWRFVSTRAYRAHFRERLGLLPRSIHRTAPGAIWFHAVSAGEIITAVPLIEQLRIDEPRIPIYISTSTASGRSVAQKRLGATANGIFYCPLDYASCVRRVLRAIKPTLVIVLETEIWPNLYAEVKRVGANLAIVNGRISSRSWHQYLAMKWFFSPVLRLPDLVFPQSVTDRDRFYRLGVPVSHLLMEGNLKYDASATVRPSELPTFGAEHVWIAASTVAPGESRHYRHDVDEDEIVLDTFESLRAEFPGLLLILAPRQPKRFDTVAQKIESRGIPFLRRTRLTRGDGLRLPGVLLLDTLGELAGAFGLADAVFVGGSLAPRGGHNILEPAAAGAAIVTGTHMENFEAICHDFVESHAMVQVSSGEELRDAIGRLLRDREEATKLGRRAKSLAAHKRGAATQVSQKLWPLYWSASTRTPHGLLARSILTLLSELWTVGGRIKMRRDQAKQQRLPLPVISIGGITMGGAGKTPFANYLATELHKRSRKPAILTRGYRRRTPARNIVLAPGAVVSAALTGDEAQIFLRSGIAAVGIGANRAETGRLLMQHQDVDVFLLDDGFQHRKLYRDIDIVLIDGLMPFGRLHTVPLGMLREPLEALSRADALVVTRADHNLRFDLIAKQLRQYNVNAPIFRAFTRPQQWRLCRERAAVDELPVRRVAAFCGIGNPQGFWNTLNKLDLDVVFSWSFPDHHVYQPAELRRLAQQAETAGAEILVTTEKDRINLPRDFLSNVEPLEVAWLEIANNLDRESDFFGWLEKKLAAGLQPV